MARKKSNLDALLNPKEVENDTFALPPNAASMRAINADNARNAGANRIELSGERKNLSTYLDTGVFPHIDIVRSQLMGITGELPSKTALIEAAIIAALNDFYEQQELSGLVRQIMQ